MERIFDILPELKSDFNKELHFSVKHNGKWRGYSTDEFIKNVDYLSYGLLELGVKKDDNIIILSNNCPEWNIADFAIQQVGAISVPLYPTITNEDLEFILKDAKVKYVFISNKNMFDKIKTLFDTSKIISFEKLQTIRHWKTLVEVGGSAPKKAQVESIKSKIKSKDLLTILYTSGTTGTPKGVMLSHENLLANVTALQYLCPFEPSWKALSFLPLNHIYERMLTYLYMYVGLSIYYAESLETIGDNLKEIKPEIFSAVPRLLEKVYNKIVGKGSELKGIKKRLFFWALNLGHRFELNKKNGWWYEFQLKIARKIIFSKWKEALGGNVQVIVSGGAALQPRLARVFSATGIKVIEGYGLTETSPVIAVNSCLPDGICFGTVGKPVDNVKVKIADDGEILCQGPSVMMGYYKNEKATKEVIDNEGWFHTGDIGEFVDRKYLKITDRKKEIFKTSGGKYIVPTKIEGMIKESKFIEQVMVVGENRNYACALIVPSFTFLVEYCKRKEYIFDPIVDVLQMNIIKERIFREVEKINARLASFETIKKIHLLPKEWSIDSGELTPKMSLRRKIILENNKKIIDSLYD